MITVESKQHPGVTYTVAPGRYPNTHKVVFTHSVHGICFFNMRIPDFPILEAYVEFFDWCYFMYKKSINEGTSVDDTFQEWKLLTSVPVGKELL